MEKTAYLEEAKSYRRQASICELNREETVFFARLCAMRALPFIGASSNFDFWVEDYRQQFLGNVINAIGALLAYNTNIVFETNAHIATIIETAHTAAHCAASNCNVAAYAAYAAAAAVSTIVADDKIIDLEAAYAAVYAIEAANTPDAHITGKPDINLHEIIDEDLLYIKSGIYDNFNNDIGLYGEIWNNFQEALKNIGLSYWGESYKNIFKSRFTLKETKSQDPKINVNYVENIQVHDMQGKIHNVNFPMTLPVGFRAGVCARTGARACLSGVNHHHMTHLPLHNMDVSYLKTRLQELTDYVGALASVQYCLEDSTKPINNSIIEENLESDMEYPAEEYYRLLLESVSKEEDIKQYRVGLDNKTGRPTVLAVVSDDYACKISEILDKAIDLELLMLEKIKRRYSFWIITDNENWRHELVKQDFPYIRKN